jgi:hypothetical protein
MRGCSGRRLVAWGEDERLPLCDLSCGLTIEDGVWLGHGDVIGGRGHGAHKVIGPDLDQSAKNHQFDELGSWQKKKCIHIYFHGVINIAEDVPKRNNTF